jgi:hypothetical protein
LANRASERKHALLNDGGHFADVTNRFASIVENPRAPFNLRGERIDLGLVLLRFILQFACMQAKVPEMSVASMWDGPSIADVGNSWEDDPKINDLVVRLAARRTALDAAERPLPMSSQAVPPRSKTRPKRSLPACSRP